NMPNKIVPINLTTLQLITNKTASIDHNLLCKCINLEKLSLVNFKISGTSDILYEFPYLSTLTFEVMINRGKRSIPLLEEINVVGNYSKFKFWNRCDMESQLEVKRLYWI